MDRDETKKIVAAVKVAFQGKFEVNPATVGIWHEVLKHIPYNLGMTAVMQYLSEAQIWPPSPGEVLVRVSGMTQPKKLNREEAWSFAMDLARRFGDGGEMRDRVNSRTGEVVRMGEGRYQANIRAAKFPALQKAIKTIGWEAFCTTPQSSLDFLRKRFFELYDDIIENEKKAHQLALFLPSREEDTKSISLHQKLLME